MRHVLRNISLLYAEPLDSPIADAALAWEADRVLWCGPEKELPQYLQFENEYHAQGAIVLPGLIDCHTHLAFGGWRAEEFAERIAGVSYLEIAKRGGGILSTVAATRKASKEELVEKCLPFTKDILSLGVTTIEAKSGYGLTTKDEMKLLEVYQELNHLTPLRIIPTFLGAHMIPPEYKAEREKYIEILLEEMLPEVAERGLARFFDVFIEESAFTYGEAHTLCKRATELGLRIKLHVDQLSDVQGGLLAQELQAVSADHLECSSKESIEALAQAETIGVLLPLASLYTFHQPADGRALVHAGVKVAVASDFNPGSAPSYHLPLALSISLVLNRLTPTEALSAGTVHAAAALGETNNLGRLLPGMKANFALIDAPSVEHWLYHFRANACQMTVVDGEVSYLKGEDH